MRTTIYVDGFNLYYRQLKERPQFKWLNPVSLCRQILDADNNITKLRYFTARVSSRIDQDAPKRQQVYFEALATVPEIELHLGNFLVSKTWAGLVPPDLDPTKPNAKPPFMPWPKVVRVFKTEEKGSDVNLASHLIHDAYQDNFDVAAVITNDTDLEEPIRIVTRELNKVVGLITPVAKPATSLAKLAAFCLHIRDSHLAAAQFPNPLQLEGGKELSRPASWTLPQ